MSNLPPKDSTGNLPAYAWPGGYPILYLDGDNCTLCAKCATESLNDDAVNFRPVATDIHYEGPSEFCENCGKEIESGCAVIGYLGDKGLQWAKQEIEKRAERDFVKAFTPNKHGEYA